MLAMSQYGACKTLLQHMECTAVAIGLEAGGRGGGGVGGAVGGRAGLGGLGSTPQRGTADRGGT